MSTTFSKETRRCARELGGPHAGPVLLVGDGCSAGRGGDRVFNSVSQAADMPLKGETPSEGRGEGTL